jgi:hypothetical protein
MARLAMFLTLELSDATIAHMVYAHMVKTIAINLLLT